ncbi:unnamed protein product, partial [Mesorhabditis belari]|uniref:Sec20 n=1 Tax=Mesorhabditis belari TaxID=2138241 RepID=A0AAF3EGQ3_9BILA
MNLAQTDVIQREILQLDTRIKARIAEIPNKAHSDQDLQVEIRAVKESNKELNAKIERLSQLKISKARIVGEKQDIEKEITGHRSEAEFNANELNRVARATKQRIAEKGKEYLLASFELETEMRHRRHEQENLQDSAARATERLSNLVSKMGERVQLAENHLVGLVDSSSLISKTGDEFTAQASHIKTGNKLLSKFERRELTDKILIFIAVCFYLATLYYILHKRFLSRFALW